MHFINLILDSLGRSSLGSRLGFSFHIAYFNSYHNNNLYHFKIGICELTINQIGLGTDNVIDRVAGYSMNIFLVGKIFLS